MLILYFLFLLFFLLILFSINFLLFSLSLSLSHIFSYNSRQSCYDNYRSEFDPFQFTSSIWSSSVYFYPIWFTTVHFSPIRSIQSIHSNSIHLVHFGVFQFTSVNLVMFGPIQSIRSIWFTSVHCIHFGPFSQFDLFQITFVQFGVPT